ncbi:heparinase II/III domain-containing protein [Oerskovia sp. USHLN155]|uniref:heparinase II/III domain-containing protein n=1 Tax=Oerskovia sp. USHLN155 TaxID=3081288 RepID=UPI0030180112
MTIDEEARRLATLMLPIGAPSHGALARTRAFLARQEIVSPGLPIAYAGSMGDLWTCTEDRRHLRRLHGFLFVSDWLAVYDDLEYDEQALVRGSIKELTTEWRAQFAGPTRIAPMAYHDETTAQRLLVFLAVQSRLPELRGEDAIVQQVAADSALLKAPDFYAGLNNHGMFQDRAVLCHAVLCPDLSASARKLAIELAVSRLSTYFDMCFTREGVHIEHTPTYHLMVARNFVEVANLLEALGNELAHAFQAGLLLAESYATHMVTPRGVYPPISDTSVRALDVSSNYDVFGSSNFRYAATSGREGDVPEDRVRVFAESGYGIFRSSWSDPGATYVLMTAAYNGGYHKHSDELSIYVESQGVQIICEAGPNGYNYSDPFTKYAFSSFAHNTLVVDGMGMPRHDGKMAETSLADVGSSAERLSVVGRTLRYSGVEFERHLEVAGESAEGSVIRVSDRVRSEQSHRYSFYWHLGVGVVPTLRGSFVELVHDGVKIAEIEFRSDSRFSLRHVAGRTAPTPLGWSFPEMGRHEPSSTLVVELSGANIDVSCTVRLDRFVLRDRGVLTPDSKWQVFDGDVPLRYLLDLPEERPTGLAVIFSAIGEVGDFTYNYRRPLEGSSIARLHVLDDFGEQGAYYYSQNRDTSIYNSVQALIARSGDLYSIGRERVLTAGSSKGGTAALIHGLGYSAGRIIVGAPQTRIGTFTENVHPNILQYISGGTGPGDRLWADEVLVKQLRNGLRSTAISIVVGTADHHLANHVAPFIADASGLGYRVNSLEIDGAKHEDVGHPFGQFLRSSVDAHYDGNGLPNFLYVDRASSSLILSIERNVDLVFSVKLYRGSELVANLPYSNRSDYRWPRLPGGRYRARIYWRRRSDGVRGVPFTTASVMVGSNI